MGFGKPIKATGMAVVQHGCRIHRGALKPGTNAGVASLPSSQKTLESLAGWIHSIIKLAVPLRSLDNVGVSPLASSNTSLIHVRPVR